MSNDQNDKSYFLHTLFDGEEQVKSNFKSLKWQIENNGSLRINFGKDFVEVFTAGLAIFLISKEFPAQDRTISKCVTINGWEYQRTFIKAFKEGEEHFENEFRVPPAVSYGENAQTYVRDIHDNYFHSLHDRTGLRKGWKFVKTDFPFIITHKIIEDYGFYSGIVSRVDQQIKKHPRLFANFEKCDHQLQLQEFEATALEENPIFRNNFDSVDPIKIIQHFRNGLVDRGYLTEQELFEYLKMAFELKTTPDQRFKIKDAPTKATIEGVFYTYYKNVAGKIHGKQKQYAALLGDYFEGYKTTSVSSNFNKSVY